MAGVGALNVEISANFARFASDMAKVSNIAEEHARKIDKVFGVVATSLQAIGAGFVIGLTLDKIKSKIEDTISSAAGLQQLSERTGATVEGLSGLASVAKLSGTDTDALAGGLQKLGKAMVDAKDGGAKTTEAFRSIGISTKDLIGLKPDEAFLLISNRLATYADGAEKTAVMQALLGKSGANLLPVAKDLADVGEYQVKVTKEQAAAADEYEKNLKRLQAANNAIYKQIGMAVLPVLNAFTLALLDTSKEAGGAKGAVGDLAKDGSIREWAESAVKFVGFVIDGFQGVSRVVQMIGTYLGGTAAAIDIVVNGKFKDIGANLANLRTQVAADIERIAVAPLFSAKLNARLDEAREKAKTAKPVEVRGNINFKPNSAENAAANADDPSRKIFDGQIKALDAFIATEKTQLATRQQSIDFYRGLDVFTLREAETRKQALITDALANELAAYEGEARLADLRAQTAAKATEREDARNRAAEIRKKATAAEVEANRAIGESQNRLLAVQITFDNATAERDRRAGIAASQAIFNLSLMGESTLAVIKANEARRIELDLAERIYQVRKLDPGADVSAAVAQAEREKATALALVAEGYEKQRSSAFGAQEAFRKYSEDAANVGAQVENALSNAFKGAEDALVNFVKTGKLDFKSLADSILSDLIRIQIRQAMGGSNGSGGWIDLVKGLVGTAGGGGNVNTSATYQNGSDMGFKLATGTNFVPYDGMKAVLHRGEAVVPAAYNPANGGAGAGGGGNVTVINNSQAQITPTRDERGDWQILVEMAASAAHDRVAGDVASGTGRVSSAMKSRGIPLSGALSRRA